MRKKNWLLWVILIPVVSVFMSGGCGGSDESTVDSNTADTLYVNGNIYTVDDEFSKAEAIAVKGGRILYVGSEEIASRDYSGADTKVVDLEGKTVIPGLIENHLHYQSTGMMDPSITIDTNWQLKATILKNVEDEAGRIGPGEDKWIYSFGWNEESPYWNLNPVTFEPLDGVTPPTKEDLDRVAPDNPVFLERTDGHSAWLNSLALELCGITKTTDDPSPDPSAPWIVKDASGELTGIIKETVMAIAREKVPLFGTDEGKLTMYKKAEEKFLSFGLTTVVDAGASYDDIKLLDEAYKNGTLEVRAYEMLSAGEEADFIRDYGNPVKDLYDGKFSVNAVKVYADGSLGSRTAWLLEDYSDVPPGNTGSGIYTPDQLKTAVKQASDYGFQVATHAIGDRAVREVVNAYEAAVGGDELSERRFRIEHYSVVQPDDLDRVIELGVIPSIQGYFAPSDHTMAPQRLGERANLAYTWRTMIKKGAKIANGSDSPVENVSPFRGIYAAVTRQAAADASPAHDPEGGWFPAERITKEEALRSYTSWGARAIFAEDDRGSLEAGKYADFVVIDRDYMSCPDLELENIRALQTYIGGKLVYTFSEESAASRTARKLNGHRLQIKGECPDCARARYLAKNSVGNR
ncbi:MAG: amidohydrolase [Synergistaceae bacterium]|jgi:predicted amidohydrolase YtcJ|nr:amidohydrolase [Synergistaceae bacterium]